jgi:hypothetical protein
MKFFGMRFNGDLDQKSIIFGCRCDQTCKLVASNDARQCLKDKVIESYWEQLTGSISHKTSISQIHVM